MKRTNPYVERSRSIVKEMIMYAQVWREAEEQHPNDGEAQFQYILDFQDEIGATTDEFTVGVCGRILAALLVEIEHRDKIVGGQVMPGGAKGALQGFMFRQLEGWDRMDEERS